MPLLVARGPEFGVFAAPTEMSSSVPVRPGPSRRRSRPRSSRHQAPPCIAAPCVPEQKTIPHPQLPARTAARQPQNVQPRILAIDVASQTTAAEIIHGAGPPHRPSLRSSRSRRQCVPCLHPCPPPPGTGEHFEPADWFRDSSIYSVHSKPNDQNQTANSQIRTSSERWAQNSAYERARLRNVHGQKCRKIG
jgi:hypothetical protein